MNILFALSNIAFGVFITLIISHYVRNSKKNWKILHVAEFEVMRTHYKTGAQYNMGKVLYVFEENLKTGEIRMTKKDDGDPSNLWNVCPDPIYIVSKINDPVARKSLMKKLGVPC